MASVKIVLRKKINKDGSYPLAIRISKNRKSSYLHVGQNIKDPKNEWDSVKQRVKRAHPNSARLNNFLLKKLAEANNKLLELETEKENISTKAVKKSLRFKNVDLSFFAQAQIYIDNLLRSKNYNRAATEKSRIKHFKEFNNGADVSFSEINVPKLNGFRAFLKSTRNVSERTIINHLLLIRTIFNQAIKGGLVDSKYYPFGKEKVHIKFPDSMKIGLSLEEVKQIEELELPPNSLLNHARNIWLFSFYFAGMRISDVLRLKLTDFNDDRLHYAMGKNLKTGSLKVPEKALKIIAEYSSQKNKNNLVFPDLNVLENLDDSFEVQRKISYAVKNLNKYLERVAKLAGVNKKLTTHIARHTFGNISGDKIPIQMLQKLYRHSSITTTIGYQSNFIYKDADDALDAVVSF